MAQIERDRYGFTVRVERDDGTVEVMADGGSSRTFDSFFPKAEAWCEERGLPPIARDSYLPEE
jgi:hypothetical protein